MLDKLHAGNRSLGTFVVALAVLAGAFGCGSPPETTLGSGGAGGTGGGTAGGAGGAGGAAGAGGDLATLDVAVGDDADGAGIPPAANVRVLFDPPGGGARQEAITDATGHVHFENIDWSKGSGALTVIGAETKAILSILDINPDSLKNVAKPTTPAQFEGEPGDVFLVTLNRRSETKHVPLGGQIENATAGGGVIVSPTVPGTLAWFVMGSYDIMVAADTPFSLITLDRVYKPGLSDGFEATSSIWSQFDVAALSGPSTMDLDLAAGKPLTPTVTSGKIELPGGANGPFEGTWLAYVLVQSSSSGLIAGMPLKTQLDPGGASWSYDLEHVDLPGQAPLRGAIVQLPLGAQTVTYRFGAPVDGETFSEFVLPPGIIAHGTGLLEPMTFEPSSGAITRISMRDPESGDLVWRVESLDTELTSMTLPKLPDTDMASLPATVTAQCEKHAVASYDTAAGGFLQAGFAAAFELKK